jgi:hypothetical protein
MNPNEPLWQQAGRRLRNLARAAVGTQPDPTGRLKATRLPTRLCLFGNRLYSSPWGPAVLVRQDAPAVDLLLVDPAVAMERLVDERRSHVLGTTTLF